MGDELALDKATKNGGSTFPIRDCFAAAAREEDIAWYLPGTMGDVMQMEIPGMATYADKIAFLRARARYLFADAMLAAREHA